MKRFTLFSFAVKNLSRKPLRTGILVVAITLFVSALVFALSFVVRVNSSIKVAAERLGADLLIVPTGSRSAAEDILLENKVKSFYMDKGLIEKVRNVEGIGEITYQTYLVTMPSLCCSAPPSIVVAFNQDTDFIVRPWLQKRIGRRLQKGEAIAGKESALNIEVGLMDVDSVLFGNVFKIVGVLDKTGSGLDTAIFISDENIDDIIKKGSTGLKPGEVSVIFAKVKKGHDPAKVAGRIEDSIIEVDAIARKDIGKGIINTLKDINRIFYITFIMASVLSIFLTWSVFSAIANERAREVGIMRAIGAKELHVVRLFLLEVVVVGVIGCILGIIFGTALSIYLAKSFNILKNLPADIGISYRFYVAAAGMIIGVGICVIGALSPIQRIKKMEPLIVIKGE